MSSEETDPTAAESSDDDHPSPGRRSTGSNGRKSKNENVDFDEEYDKLRDQMSGGLALLDELRSTLESQVDGLKDRSLKELVEQKDDLEALRSVVVKAKKMLHGTEKFLVEDFTTSLTKLRETLKRYSQMIFDKLQKERKTKVSAGTGGGKVVARRSGEDYEKILADIAVELKKMELFVAELEDTAGRLAVSDATDEADEADRLLDEAAETASVAHEGDREQGETTEETDEERQAREDKKRQEAEEEERRRREAEERRLAAEAEEERKRQEAEQRRLDEARRLEEEQERLRKEDPKHWPAILYDVPVEDDPLGSGIACVVRANEELMTLRREQLQCSLVNWRQNRYKVAENEEVVGSIINLRPADGRPMQFESTVWVAVPYSSVSRNRETIIKFQDAAPPRAPTPPAPVEEPVPAVTVTAEKGDDPEKTEGSSEEAGDERVKTPSPAPVAPPPPAVRSPTPAPVVQPDPASWNDVYTRDTTVEGQEAVRFVETPVKELDADGVNILVLTRPKLDCDQWSNKGGRLVSSVDQRISVSGPKNVVKQSTDVTLQIIAIDSSLMAGLKERYDGCEQLLGTSPMMLMTFSTKPSKPLTFTTTNPSGGGKKQKPDVNNKNGKAAGKAYGSQDQDVEDMLSLLVKEPTGKWRHRDNVKLEQQRDCVTFQLPEAVQRLIMLRTAPSVDSTSLCRIATSLESSLAERPAQLIVRQNAEDPTLVFIECCRRDAVDKLLSGRLQAAKFTDGPEPSRPFVLHEGDLIEVSFRDNINAVEQSDGPRQFIFNSNLSTINQQLTINEVNIFAQNALDVYRGYVRLSLVERPYQPPPKFAPPSSTATSLTVAGKKPAAGGNQKSAAVAATTVDKNLITEVLLTLPKPAKEKTMIKRIQVPINGPEPLSSEYFDQLASDLGEDWTRLADKLKLSSAAVQRIVSTYAELDSPPLCTQKSAKEMLVQWYRSSTKSNNKVDDLRQALVDAGRNDLAEDLNNKYKEARQEIDRKNHELRLQKSVKLFLGNIQAVKAWREVGRGLGISAEDLQAIGGPPPIGRQKVVIGEKEAREFAEKMLTKWQETPGENVSRDCLLSVVKKLKLNDITASITMIC